MKMHFYLMTWGIDVTKNTKFLRGELNFEHRNDGTQLLTKHRCNWAHR
jgi:hypothetical protein